MEQLTFDSGVKSYRLGEMGVLRFNPADPNLFARFLDAAGEITECEKSLTQTAQAGGEGAQVLALLGEADREMKAILCRVFPGNDFAQILGGVNLLAVADNGERVITNLMAALEPVLLEGAQRCARAEAGK